MFDFHRAAEAIEEGERAARAALAAMPRELQQATKTNPPQPAPEVSTEAAEPSPEPAVDPAGVPSDDHRIDVDSAESD